MAGVSKETFSKAMIKQNNAQKHNTVYSLYVASMVITLNSQKITPPARSIMKFMIFVMQRDGVA